MALAASPREVEQWDDGWCYLEQLRVARRPLPQRGALHCLRRIRAAVKFLVMGKSRERERAVKWERNGEEDKGQEEIRWDLPHTSWRAGQQLQPLSFSFFENCSCSSALTGGLLFSAHAISCYTITKHMSHHWYMHSPYTTETAIILKNKYCW
jgi:hypothetical protein